MSTFRARELDQRVTIRREVRTSDGMGGSTLSWTNLATVWAKVRPMSGREREHSDKVNAQSNYIIVIRYRSDLTESDILVWKDTEFNIRFAKDTPRSRFLVLEAEKGVPV
jgi:SPP1 family predicted phage head-tail adaptor